MICVTGDTHIPLDIEKLNSKNFPQQKKMSKSDYMIICGDFGGVWSNSNEEKFWLNWLNNRNFTTLFVDGNHENFDLLNKYEVKEWNGGNVHFIRDSIIHLMRGQVFLFDRLKFFTMGGGNSIDKQYRTINVSWWVQEMPSAEEYETALTNLEKHNFNIDYIITHAAPESIMSQFYPDHPDEKPLNLFLEEVKQKTTYKKWYMGHLHFDIAIDDRHRMLLDDVVKV